jgi:hypothetical protein
MMYRVMTRIKPWPEYDLFDYSLPIPLKINLTGNSNR